MKMKASPTQSRSVWIEAT